MNPITIIKMRKGSEYTVSRQQGDAIRSRIAENQGSTFIHIPSIGITVNSADISEITDDFEKVAQKENLLGTKDWTDQDRKKLTEVIKQTRVHLEDAGVFKEAYSNLRAKWRAEGLAILDNCRECHKKLPNHLREFCSTNCKRTVENPV